MTTAFLGWACVVTMLAVSALAIYQWVLAVVSLLPSRIRATTSGTQRTRFVILIPAHDEEDTLSGTLASLRQLAYPSRLVRVVVVADRCHDDTVRVAKRYAVDCLERNDGRQGKGAAIAWAIEELRTRGAEFDALAIIDADTIADPQLLDAFDKRLRSGHHVQQAYNYLSNPWETPFTRIIAVTSLLRNGLYYKGKERLGLSAMLSGCGMCFSRTTLERHRWSAFSVGEDWEYSVSLLLGGERIHFNEHARVLAKESRDFRQASSQRLRWASGRQAVAGASARNLFEAGIRRGRLDLLDSALTIVAPTYSAQAALALLCLAIGWLLSLEPGWQFLFTWARLPIGLLGGYFLLGVALTGAPAKALVGLLLVPAFLPWRLAIEILGLMGYGRRQWVRTSRV